LSYSRVWGPVVQVRLRDRPDVVLAFHVPSARYFDAGDQYMQGGRQMSMSASFTAAAGGGPITHKVGGVDE
jgi:hypothetical protein